jgi:hypothetical protein
VRSRNISDTDVFDVALLEVSTPRPTGSPTRANLRVETPARRLSGSSWNFETAIV